jgi:hypothetical protein
VSPAAVLWGLENRGEAAKKHLARIEEHASKEDKQHHEAIGEHCSKATEHLEALKKELQKLRHDYEGGTGDEI